MNTENIADIITDHIQKGTLTAEWETEVAKAGFKKADINAALHLLNNKITALSDGVQHVQDYHDKL